MLGDVNMFEDMYFSASNITKGKCGGYYTRIDKFDLFCSKDLAPTPAHDDYCNKVFVNCFEAILPENEIQTEDG